jgi:CubicO group peptidase (beta-lactamase class C family)
LIPAGVLAIMKGDKIIVSRGFGYMERTLQTPVPPDAILRLASNDKVITKGAVMQLISSGAIDTVTGRPIQLDTKVFPFFAARGIAPPVGATPDPRINDITINHLLEHQSGIQELPSASVLYNALGVTADEIGPEHNVSWIYGAPLRNTPGSEFRYCSSGYFLLRYLVHLVTGDFKTFLDEFVLDKTGTTDIVIAYERLNQRNSREPWYATNENCYDRWINLENYFALSASAEGMVRYLRRYHLGRGTVLEDPNTGEWAPVPDAGWDIFYGGMPGTWSVSYQRRWDQVNLALFFNQSGDYDNLFQSLIDSIETIPEDGWGTGTHVSEHNTNVEIAEKFHLSQNYPNPFNPSTTIYFNLPTAATLSLSVFDITGRRVKNLLRGNYPAGVHKAIWDATGLPTGLYICRLESGLNTQTCKMVLLR